MATLKGRALLGWLTRDQAIAFLLNDCFFDPPIDAAQAEAIWRPYRDRAEAIPERPFSMPLKLTLDPQERAHAQRFMAFLRARGDKDVIEVAKVDLSQLAVIQYCITTELSDGYAPKIQSSAGWRNECLSTTIRNSVIKFKGQREGPNGLSTSAEVDVPHGEHYLELDPKTGLFGVVQPLRHVTVMENGQRMFLRAGYHRSFARVFTAPIANVPSATVALARNTLTSPALSALNAPGVNPGVGLDPFGCRAGLFSDFFTDGLFMDVSLRKKKYQLQVKATWVALDDPT